MYIKIDVWFSYKAVVSEKSLHSSLVWVRVVSTCHHAVGGEYRSTHPSGFALRICVSILHTNLGSWLITIHKKVQKVNLLQLINPKLRGNPQCLLRHTYMYMYMYMLIQRQTEPLRSRTRSGICRLKSSLVPKHLHVFGHCGWRHMHKVCTDSIKVLCYMCTWYNLPHSLP